MTTPEQILWQVLRAGRLGAKFQRQVVVPPHVADFASRSGKLIIEIDGDSHTGREAYDAARTAHLESAGYRVVRFANSDVMNNIEGVTRAISMALGLEENSPLSPTLSP